MDSGASDHMVYSSALVTNSTPSIGDASVLFGNGTSFPISRVGTSTIANNVSLNDVLVVPNLTKNLLSFSKLTHDNDVNVVPPPPPQSVYYSRSPNEGSASTRKVRSWAICAICGYTSSSFFLFSIKIKALMNYGILDWVILHLILLHYYIIWDIWRFLLFYRNQSYVHLAN